EALGGERSIEARQVRCGPRGGAVARGVSGRRRRLRCRVRPAGGLYREQRAGAYGREREQSGKARAIRHGTPPADATRSSTPGRTAAPSRRFRLAAPRLPVRVSFFVTAIISVVGALANSFFLPATLAAMHDRSAVLGGGRHGAQLRRTGARVPSAGPNG